MIKRFQDFNFTFHFSVHIELINAFLVENLYCHLNSCFQMGSDYNL